MPPILAVIEKVPIAVFLIIMIVIIMVIDIIMTVMMSTMIIDHAGQSRQWHSSSLSFSVVNDDYDDSPA